MLRIFLKESIALMGVTPISPKRVYVWYSPDCLKYGPIASEQTEKQWFVG
jgi:hypothetical protein